MSVQPPTAYPAHAVPPSVNPGSIRVMGAACVVESTHVAATRRAAERRIIRDFM